MTPVALPIDPVLQEIIAALRRQPCVVIRVAPDRRRQDDAGAAGPPRRRRRRKQTHSPVGTASRGRPGGRPTHGVGTGRPAWRRGRLSGALRQLSRFANAHPRGHARSIAAPSARRPISRIDRRRHLRRVPRTRSGKRSRARHGAPAATDRAAGTARRRDVGHDRGGKHVHLSRRLSRDNLRGSASPGGSAL